MQSRNLYKARLCLFFPDLFQSRWRIFNSVADPDVLESILSAACIRIKMVDHTETF